MVDHPNAILDDKIAVGFKSGPEFLTSILPLPGGFETRNARRAKARWKFEFSGAEQDVDSVRALMDFYLGRRGPAYSWLLKDFWSYQLKDEIIRVATGGETTAQITKSYDLGGNPYVRTLKYIKNSTLKVFIDGVQDMGATQTNGLITFSSPLSAGDVVTVGAVSAPTEFYTPVRFMHDFAGLEMTSQSANWGSLPNFDAQEVLE